MAKINKNKVKRTKNLFLFLLFIYILIQFFGKITCMFWANPFNEVYYEIKENERPYTKHEIENKLKLKSWSYAEWPYNFSVKGTNILWTLQFNPYPLTWRRRIWLAFAYWNFNPKVPATYEIDSGKMTIKRICSDGKTYYTLKSKR